MHQNIKSFSSEGAPQVNFNSFHTREATFTTRRGDWQDKDDLHKHWDILERQTMVCKHFFPQGVVFHVSIAMVSTDKCLQFHPFI